MALAVGCVNLRRRVVTHLMLREGLREAFPDADDDDLQDTQEGLTNLPEMLAALLRSQLDDLSLAAALKAGREVPGAMLTNGSPFISVRTK